MRVSNKEDNMTGMPHRKGMGAKTVNMPTRKERDAKLQQAPPRKPEVIRLTPAMVEALHAEAVVHGERRIFGVPQELARYFHYSPS